MVVWIVECLLIVTVMMGIVLEQQKRLNRAREKGWEESSDFERMEGRRLACTLRDGGCCKKNRVVVRGLFLDTHITQQEIMKWAILLKSENVNLEMNIEVMEYKAIT